MWSRRPRELPRRSAGVAGRFLDAAALAFALAWLLRGCLGPWSWPLPIVLNAWTLAGPLFLAGALAAAWSRRPFRLALQAALFCAWAAQHGSELRRARVPWREAGADELLLVTLNAGDERAPPDELARWALDLRADLLFLQELGPRQAAALEEACRELYPWRELHGLGRPGKGVHSRHPLSGVRLLPLPDGRVALVGQARAAARSPSRPCTCPPGPPGSAPGDGPTRAWPRSCASSPGRTAPCSPATSTRRRRVRCSRPWSAPASSTPSP